MGGQRAQQRRVEVVGDLRQLIGGGARRADVTGGEHDLDERRKQPRPRHPVLCLSRHATDRRLRGVDLPLGQSEPRQTGLRLSSAPAGLVVRLLGLRELAAQPVQLALLVEGGTDRRLRPPEEPLARPLRRVDRVRPGAAQLHDLGAMHQAVAAERDEIRLRVAPVRQRRRPLLRPTQIEDLLARLDHAAVDGPGDDLGHLVGHHRDHDLVEQGHSLDSLSLPDQRPALNVAGERHQIDVTEPIADLGRLAGDRVGARPVARDRVLKRDRHQQMPSLRAVALAIVEQPACPREPAAAASELAAVHQDEDHPAGTACGPLLVTPAQELVMRTLPHLDAVLIPADEIRRHREPLEVLRLERGLPIRGGQLGEGIRPRPPVEALAPARACLGARHTPAPDDSPATSASRGAPNRASVSPDTRASYARRVAASL